MTESFLEKYKAYLKQKISKADFSIFKNEIGKMSDRELCNLMVENAIEEGNDDKMPFLLKETIFRQINHTIMWHRIRPIIQYAAIFIIGGLCLGLLAKQWYNTPDQEVRFTMSTGNKGDVSLPDGTNVKLNSATTIVYHTDTKNQRMVDLSGEAFFDVAHNPDKPFRVAVNGLQIEVLGTTFNINTHKDGIVETYLSTGRIRLSGDDLKKVYYLNPGQKAIYNENSHQLQIVKTDDHVETGWQDNYLIFEKEPLHNVIAQIERWYGVKIQLNNTVIASDRMSGSFRNETLENVIKSISKQYNFKYSIQKENITIY